MHKQAQITRENREYNMKIIAGFVVIVMLAIFVGGMQRADHKDRTDKQAESLCASKHMKLYVDKKNRFRDLSLSKTIPCVDKNGIIREF